MGVDEIRPGMVGIGRTVFEGTRVEEFKVNILGVLENVIGTHRNLILARLEGGPLANTGVIAGMSGSPVYVDGRLIGAVSYALGQFSKEPIAGITPIAEMTDATAFNDVRPAAAKIHVEFPLTRENVELAFRRALNWNRPFVDHPGDAALVGANAISGVAGAEIGTLLRPIATPLIMSGFEPGISDLLGGAFGSQGFIPTGRGTMARAGEKPYDGPLKPGDAIGVMLVSGDLELGATGTVTHVDGGKVYAFGHPLYNLGPTAFPMTRAYVYTVLPSLASSLKVSTTGDIIGSFLQDRATAIAGRLGPGPKTIPVTLTLEQEAGRAPKRTFHFQLANDQMFTPLMAAASITSTLGAYERQYGAATFHVTGTAKIAKHDSITFDNIFSGDQPSVNAATYIAAPVAALLGNDYEKVDIESLDLSITSAEEPRTATLERVWIDDQRPRAGRTVPLKVLLRTYRGDEQIKTIPIEIPANLSGTLSLLVADGGRMGQIEQRETRSSQPRSVEQIVRTLNRTRRGNTLYVKLLGAGPGAVVRGEPLTALPPSVLAVLEGDRSGGSFNPLTNATLGEWQLATDQAVTGSKTLSITVAAE
ncbi:MAG TPA: SpoIVB peptidase S55 domain-containing protein [Vicinamibacterales bacterium]|nr:SpoIVB peptidase S55 domain-containing protein [Vicinamibacterales bacterium]